MRRRLFRLVIVFLVSTLALSCSPEENKPVENCAAGLPEELPFEFTREDVGEPLSDAEISEFTRKITGLWKQADWFAWVRDTSHGIDKATGLSDWMVWWAGTELTKESGQVTFRHRENGGPDNIMIPTPKLLIQAMSLYLAVEDPAAAEVTEQYAKGMTATMLGMVWNDSDPVRSIMARAVIPESHSVTLPDGRVKQIDYSAWRHETQAWNSDTIQVSDNPYFGDIWVKNMRSKDDVPHIYRAAAFLPYCIACAADDWVREAVTETREYLEGFARDIVDHGYWIRTKDKDGNIFIPEQDLASFVSYEVFDANAECTAKLSSALLGYAETRGNDCGKAATNVYEQMAVVGHYYNLAIIRGFHMSALLLALMNEERAAAYQLLLGMVERADREKSIPLDVDVDQARWDADLAVFLLQASSCGLPLTSEEARLIHQEYGKAVEVMEAFELWDPWSDSVADGTYLYVPWAQVEAEAIAFILEHCFSPFRNKAGARVVDCQVVMDPQRWGT